MWYYCNRMQIFNKVLRIIKQLSNILNVFYERMKSNLETVRRMMLSMPMVVLSCMLFSMTAMCVEMVDKTLSSNKILVSDNI